MDLSKLAEPFPAEDIEWRIGQSGKKQDGKFWAKVLAYVTARAIMGRLDEVCGVDGWHPRYRFEEGGVMCELAIRVQGGPGEEDVMPDWVTKEDGSDASDIEKFKGAISGALKRAGAVWGIGRYLYNLDEGWAECYPGNARGRRYAKTKDGVFYWTPPKLPDWALPIGATNDVAPGHKPRAPEGVKSDAASAKSSPRPDKTYLTAAQQKQIQILRREAEVEEDDYRAVLMKRYQVETSSDLEKKQATDFIKRLGALKKAVEARDAEDTFSVSARVKELRGILSEYCTKLRGWNEKTARGDRLDYRSYGLKIDTVGEIEQIVTSMADERELENVITQLDNLFAAEVF